LLQLWWKTSLPCWVFLWEEGRKWWISPSFIVGPWGVPIWRQRRQTSRWGSGSGLHHLT
jgi:hypothetical protein